MRRLVIFKRNVMLVALALLFTPFLVFGGGSSERASEQRSAEPPAEPPQAARQAPVVNPPLEVEYLTEQSALEQGYAAATFAGGCFWCMEGPYDALDGVISTTPGYSGGHVVNPRYQQVVSGTTGHTEVVQVIYDPQKISYEELLEEFWVNIDPLDAGGQFCDRGSQYRSEIFYHNEEQRAAALASRQRLNESGILPAPIVTEVTALDAFYPAEEYHHDYYRTNALRYRFYRAACGRDARLDQLWGDYLQS